MVTARLMWKWVCATAVALAVGLGVSSVLLAAAPPPKAAAKKTPKKPPKKPTKKLLPPSLRPRFARSARFWHAYARLNTPPRLWAGLGYAYYAGGTDYVADTAEGDTDETGGRFVELQTLVDMVHEWRTINESAEVHKRVRDGEGARAALAPIRVSNQAFDKAARRAMAELAKGNSAEDELEAARTALEQLIEAVERLPEN